MQKILLLVFVCLFGLSSFAKPNPRKIKRKDLSRSMAFPVAGSRSNIASLWGATRGGGSRKHMGIDIYAKKGTPVVAIASGIVTRREVTKFGGKTLWLKPDGQNWIGYYAHLDEQRVKAGQRVRKGQVIGTVGKSGNAKNTPSHLHFGIKPGKDWVNPLPYVKHSTQVSASVKTRNASDHRQKKTMKQLPAKKHNNRN